MFDRKKKQTKKVEKESDVAVRTIPDIFYGGKDPEIYHPRSVKEKPLKEKPQKKEEEKEEIKEPVGVEKPQLVRAHTQPKPAGATLQQPQTPQLHEPKKRSRLFFILILLLVLAIAFGATWFFLLRDAPASAPLPSAPVFEQPDETGQDDDVQAEPPTVEERVEEDPIVRGPVKIKLPSTFAITSADLDNDELTDAEEEVFGTDPGIWDTDEDGYFDGLEPRNLYSPRGFAPTKIIDSGLVQEYVNPLTGYRVYYPVNWVVDTLVEDGSHVLISAITGDFVSIQVHEKDTFQSFNAWFAQHIDGSIIDMSSQANRFQMDYYMHESRRAAIYETDTHVMTIMYTIGPSGQVLYPQIMEMIVQSFRSQRTDATIPEQPILPNTTPPDAASSPELPEEGDVSDEETDSIPQLGDELPSTP
jgi:hypothetical protein